MNERESKLRHLMAAMPQDVRENWCNPGEHGCGCLGCANGSGGLARLGYTEPEWRYVMNVPAVWTNAE